MKFSRADLANRFHGRFAVSTSTRTDAAEGRWARACGGVLLDSRHTAAASIYAPDMSHPLQRMLSMQSSHRRSACLVADVDLMILESLISSLLRFRVTYGVGIRSRSISQ